MALQKLLKRSALTACAFSLLAALSACEGRTADNMIPDGDTVEVSIPGAASRSGSSDSYPVPADSIPEHDSL